MVTSNEESPSTQKISLIVRNKKIFFYLILFVLIICALIFWLITTYQVESTENAYVDGNVIQVSAQAAGTITSINADTTDSFKKGDVLVTLNPIDAEIELQEAKAELAKTVRQVQGLYSSASKLQANINLKQSNLNKSIEDLKRRQELVSINAISTEEYTHMKDAVTAAEAELQVSREEYKTTLALTHKISIYDHPEVQAAALKVKNAMVNLTRTQIKTPVSGIITKRNVQVGQRVSQGSALMSIVSTDKLWVTANFQEQQLKNLRIGQPVTLTADIYGRSVKYKGTLQGIDAGTGSAFSLLPTQNATGNWIKVVQRIPVRIQLNTEDLNKHPLRIGLSMKVKVDTHHQDGQALAHLNANKTQQYSTDIYQNEDDGGNKLVQEIIRQNINTK